MQTMATKAQRHQNDANKDAADPTVDLSIDSDVLRSLVMDVTMEILTAISDTMIPVAATSTNSLLVIRSEERVS